jgi:Armadillo/beta-catenin-like repeat
MSNMPAQSRRPWDTKSRDGVPVLIKMLASEDRSLRQQAAGALLTLTHHDAGRNMDDWESMEAADDWRSWWAMNGPSAVIYGTDQYP